MLLAQVVPHWHFPSIILDVFKVKPGIGLKIQARNVAGKVQKWSACSQLNCLRSTVDSAGLNELHVKGGHGFRSSSLCASLFVPV